ncbi:MAG TPA: hypothetical protein VF680_04405 [Allosphingosinicella sp.]
MSDFEAPTEAGYHKIEREQFEGLVRENWWISAVTLAVAIPMAALNPIGALFEWMFSGSDDDDREEAPDYSMAERIPEDEK